MTGNVDSTTIPFVRIDSEYRKSWMYLDNRSARAAAIDGAEVTSLILVLVHEPTSSVPCRKGAYQKRLASGSASTIMQRNRAAMTWKPHDQRKATDANNELEGFVRETGRRQHRPTRALLTQDDRETLHLMRLL